MPEHKGCYWCGNREGLICITTTIDSLKEKLEDRNLPIKTSSLKKPFALDNSGTELHFGCYCEDFVQNKFIKEVVVFT